MVHKLKILPKYFKEVELGHKTFEIRKADREYKVGDKLILREWDNGFTGKEIVRHISYIYQGCGEYGLSEGYCILGLKRSGPIVAFDNNAEKI